MCAVEKGGGGARVKGCHSTQLRESVEDDGKDGSVRRSGGETGPVRGVKVSLLL